MATRETPSRHHELGEGRALVYLVLLSDAAAAAAIIGALMLL